MEIRTRTTDSTRSEAPEPWNDWSGAKIGDRPFVVGTDLVQETRSEGHPWHLAKRPGFKGVDIGGPFFSERYVWNPMFRDNRFTLVGWYMRYKDGHIHTILPDKGAFNHLREQCSPVQDYVMDSWGTSAISKVIPTKSKVDLAVSAVELAREGLPKMIGEGLLKSKLKDVRKLGDEFLNIEFGIKPLISDIVGTSQAIVEAAERIKQLERDSGRLVRRKFSFPDRDETFVTTQTGAAATPPGWSFTYLWSDYGRNRRTTETAFKTRRWFSGAFTYHLDLGKRQRNQLYAAADNARLLLGVKLDAEVLWNLAPWSWLADWFGNVGDIATNISHFSRDGLVMPYGYMMAESSVHQRTVADLYWSDPAGPSKVVDAVSYTVKQRRPAHPFGFGFSDMVLDTRQTSILAALGISKAPRW